MLAVSACPPPGPACDAGYVKKIVAYSVINGFSADGAIQPSTFESDGPHDQTGYCYVLTAGGALMPFEIELDKNNQFMAVGTARGAWNPPLEPANLEGAKVRVATACKQPDKTPFLDSIAVRGLWFDGVTKQFKSQFEITPNFRKDTRLIAGEGILCFYNESNVPAYGYVEQYLPRWACGPSAHPVNPTGTLEGSILPANFESGCNPVSIPRPTCPLPEESFGTQVFCEECEGPVYTERITQEFTNYCYSLAREQAEGEAANCVIADGPCP
jgi:hypothetical protein